MPLLKDVTVQVSINPASCRMTDGDLLSADNPQKCLEILEEFFDGGDYKNTFLTARDEHGTETHFKKNPEGIIFRME